MCNNREVRCDSPCHGLFSMITQKQAALLVIGVMSISPCQGACHSSSKNHVDLTRD